MGLDEAQDRGRTILRRDVHLLLRQAGDGLRLWNGQITRSSKSEPWQV